MKLNVPIRKSLFEDLLLYMSIEESVESYFKDFGEDTIYDVNLVLRRVKMSDNIHDNDINNKININLGLFEEAALRIHLYLTCIETISRLLSTNKYVSYINWLNAKKEPYLSQKQAIEFEGDGLEIDIARKMFETYNHIYGVKNVFYLFFTDCLRKEQVQELLKLIIVIKEKPLPGVYHINKIDPNKSYENDDLARTARAIKSWNRLNFEQKIINLSSALYAIRNSYTHSLIPYTSVQDKLPENLIPKLEGFIDRGDTVFVWERNIAIGGTHKPITYYLREMIMIGLSNYIIKKKFEIKKNNAQNN